MPRSEDQRPDKWAVIYEDDMGNWSTRTYESEKPAKEEWDELERDGWTPGLFMRVSPATTGDGNATR